MRDGHHGAVRVEVEFKHQVVGHGLAEGAAGNVPGQVVFLAWVAADHLEVQCQRHLREHARQLPGADDQHAPARAEQGAKPAPVEAELFVARGRLDGHGARLQVEAARHQFVLGSAAQHLVDPVRAVQRLLHQPQVATARQAEPSRLFLGHAVGDQRRLIDAFAVTHPVDQVVFDAAARDRADHQRVVTQAQQRAGWARRRPPGLDHRDEPHLVARSVPFAGLVQHLQVQTVHANSL